MSTSSNILDALYLNAAENLNDVGNKQTSVNNLLSSGVNLSMSGSVSTTSTVTALTLNSTNVNSTTVTATNLNSQNLTISGGASVAGSLTANSIITGQLLWNRTYTSALTLPSASTYAGMFAVRSDNSKAYYSVANNWLSIATNNELTSAIDSIKVRAQGNKLPNIPINVDPVQNLQFSNFFALDTLPNNGLSIDSNFTANVGGVDYTRLRKITFLATSGVTLNASVNSTTQNLNLTLGSPSSLLPVKRNNTNTVNSSSLNFVQGNGVALALSETLGQANLTINSALTVQRNSTTIGSSSILNLVEGSGVALSSSVGTNGAINFTIASPTVPYPVRRNGAGTINSSSINFIQGNGVNLTLNNSSGQANLTINSTVSPIGLIINQVIDNTPLDTLDLRDGKYTVGNFVRIIPGGGLQIKYDIRETYRPRLVASSDYDVYVSPSGDDLNNTGLTLASPFRTIQKAIDYLSYEVDLRGKRPFIRVQNGMYQEDLVITSKLVGTGAPLRIIGPAINFNSPSIVISEGISPANSVTFLGTLVVSGDAAVHLTNIIFSGQLVTEPAQPSLAAWDKSLVYSQNCWFGPSSYATILEAKGHAELIFLDKNYINGLGSKSIISCADNASIYGFDPTQVLQYGVINLFGGVLNYSSSLPTYETLFFTRDSASINKLRLLLPSTFMDKKLATLLDCSTINQVTSDVAINAWGNGDSSIFVDGNAFLEFNQIKYIRTGVI